MKAKKCFLMFVLASLFFLSLSFADEGDYHDFNVIEFPGIKKIQAAYNDRGYLEALNFITNLNQDDLIGRTVSFSEEYIHFPNGDKILTGKLMSLGALGLVMRGSEGFKYVFKEHVIWGDVLEFKISGKISIKGSGSSTSYVIPVSYLLSEGDL